MELGYINQQFINEFGFDVCKPYELYADMFQLGSGLIQKKGEYNSFKTSPIMYVNDNFSAKDNKPIGKWKHFIMLEDTFEEQLETHINDYEYLLMNGCTYFGKKKDKAHIDKCYGLIMDLDDMNEENLQNYLTGITYEYLPGRKAFLTPNYIIVSKSLKGLHLYYLFDEPITLYPNYKIALKELKYRLTTHHWNEATTTNKYIQYQSYDQSFMCAGTIVKGKKEYKNLICYKIQNRKYSFEELLKKYEIELKGKYQPTQYTLEKAKEKFPDWYDRRIVKGDTSKKYWTCKKDLYNWWLKIIQQEENGATYGHRYWCTMCLFIYAIKSGVSKEQAYQDAVDLLPHMNKLNDKKPFTISDIKSASECYDKDFNTFPIKDIERLSQITIERNKRNGRKQKQHIEIMNAIRDVVYPNGEWRNKDGRPSKQEQVKKWQLEHPDGKKIECEKETGLSRHTVLKWWDSKDKM